MFVQTTATAFVDSVLKLNEFGSEPAIFYSRDLDDLSTPPCLLKWREKEEVRVKIQTCTFSFLFVCSVLFFLFFERTYIVRLGHVCEGETDMVRVNKARSTDSLRLFDQ